MTSPHDASAPADGAPSDKPAPLTFGAPGLAWDAPGLTFPPTDAPSDNHHEQGA